MPLDLSLLPLRLEFLPLLVFLGLAFLYLSIGIVINLGVGPKIFLFPSLRLGWASNTSSPAFSSDVTSPLELFSKGKLGVP